MRIGEDVLDWKIEGGGDPVGKVERRIVPLGLERVHRLARDADRSGQALLGPAALGAQEAQPAFQAWLSWMKGVTMPKAPQKKG